MLSCVVPSTLAIISSLLTSTPDAQTVLETVRAKQAERWASVDNYTITISVRDAGGLETSVYYEKMEVDGQPTFRMIPPPEYYRSVSEQGGFPPPGPEFMEQYARGIDQVGDVIAGGGGDMPAMDYRGMTSQMSAFARAGAAYEEDDGRGDAENSMRDMAEFSRRARLVGTEAVAASDGQPPSTRDAFRVVAEDLSDIELDQPGGDAKFTLDRVSLWIDTEHYVPLRLLMEGQVEVEGKKTPITIEKLDLEYKQVGPLYESHQQVFKLGGLMAGMSEKDRKDLEKAVKEMEEAKQQLDELPEDQRAMVMKMMGPKMEELEKMAAGGEITSTTDVMSVAINEGPPTSYGPGTLTVGGPAAADYPGVLTVAGDDGGAELGIAARLPGTAEAFIGLFGAGPFPQSGSMDITDASGEVKLEGGASVNIEGGSGTITVTERTATRIVGTFTALLTGSVSTDSGSNSIQFSASGSFDTGAPVGPGRSLRGSPIPADLFQRH